MARPREFDTEALLDQAGMAFHNALKGFEEKGDEQGIANAADLITVEDVIGKIDAFFEFEMYSGNRP